MKSVYSGAVIAQHFNIRYSDMDEFLIDVCRQQHKFHWIQHSAPLADWVCIYCGVSDRELDRRGAGNPYIFLLHMLPITAVYVADNESNLRCYDNTIVCSQGYNSVDEIPKED